MQVGIIGGGQLGRMLALSAYPLGIKTVCLDPSLACSASFVTETIQGHYDDLEKIRALQERCDVLTYEFENIDAGTLAYLAESTQNTQQCIYPSVSILKVVQDRLNEKQCFEHLGIPTTRYKAVDSQAALYEAAEAIGLPAVLKTRRMGYDGKGQYLLYTAQDIQLAWEALKGQPLLLENQVSFDREVSCIGVRGICGDVRFYTIVENQHKQGILHLSHARPQKASTTDHLIALLAQTYLKRIFTEYDYRGVLTVEFFEKNQSLIANEMAPRVHNSGHWTIEGATTSQFENHIRAICGLPLGATQTLYDTTLFNLIGGTPPLETLLSLPDAHVHLYQKSKRPGRKLGHITLSAASQDQLRTKEEQLADILAES